MRKCTSKKGIQITLKGMSFYSFISSHLLLCASLFLFYFGFMSFPLFVWKGWCDPRTGGAVELLIYHRFVAFLCWFRYTEFFFLHFSEFEKYPCNFLSNWAAFACLEHWCFPVAVSACRGCASSCKPSAPSSAPITPRSWTRCSKPSVAPRGTKEKGISVPCGICPLTSLTFSCLKRRLCDLFPTNPCQKGHSWENTALLYVLV